MVSFDLGSQQANIVGQEAFLWSLAWEYQTDTNIFYKPVIDVDLECPAIWEEHIFENSARVGVLGISNRGSTKRYSWTVEPIHGLTGSMRTRRSQGQQQHGNTGTKATLSWLGASHGRVTIFTVWKRLKYFKIWVWGPNLNTSNYQSRIHNLQTSPLRYYSQAFSHHSS